MISVLVLIFGGFGGLAIWEFAGAFACFFEVTCCILVMPYAIYLDIRDAAIRRAKHPDNNFHNLPRLNAVGFDKNGTPILPSACHNYTCPHPWCNAEFQWKARTMKGKLTMALFGRIW